MPCPVDRLLYPETLVRGAQALSQPGGAPARSGAYAWYFSAMPGGTPVPGLHGHGGDTLLYVGISRRSLRKRIHQHCHGRVRGSTLRFSLAALLLDLPAFLPPAPDGRPCLSPAGEEAVSGWLAAHGRLCWVEHDEPKKLEDCLMQRVVLPLNLRGNPVPSLFTGLRDKRGLACGRTSGRPGVPALDAA